MLVFVVSCDAGGVPNERGRAGAANVEGVRVEGAVAAAATFGVAITVGCGVGVDKVGGVDKAVGIAVGAAAADSGVGVDDAGAVGDPTAVVGTRGRRGAGDDAGGVVRNAVAIAAAFDDGVGVAGAGAVDEGVAAAAAGVAIGGVGVAVAGFRGADEGGRTSVSL